MSSQHIYRTHRLVNIFISFTIHAELLYMAIGESCVSAGVHANGSYCVNKHYLTIGYIYRKTRCIVNAQGDPRERAEGNATLTSLVAP